MASDFLDMSNHIHMGAMISRYDESNSDIYLTHSAFSYQCFHAMAALLSGNFGSLKRPCL